MSPLNDLRFGSYLDSRMFINYRIVGIFKENKCKSKKCKQSETSGNYRHLNKMDILDNVNGNVDKV